MSPDAIMVVVWILLGALIMDLLFEFLRKGEGFFKHTDLDESGRDLRRELRRHDRWR